MSETELDPDKREFLSKSIKRLTEDLERAHRKNRIYAILGAGLGYIAWGLGGMLCDELLSGKPLVFWGCVLFVAAHLQEKRLNGRK